MKAVELLEKGLVFASRLEGQEDIFWILEEKLESSSQFVFINSFKTNKQTKRMGQGYAEDQEKLARKKGEPHQQFGSLSLPVTDPCERTQVCYTLVYIPRQNSSFQLVGWGLLMTQSR